MTKSETYGLIGTIVFNTLLILLLMYFGLSVTKEEIQEEGIEINFGDGIDGAPSFSETTEPSVAPNMPTPTPPAPSTSSEPSITQEDPSVAIAAKEKEKQKQKQEQLRQEQIRQEQQRLAEERARQEAEQKRIAEQEAKKAKAANLGNVFGKSAGNTTGSGVGGGGQGSTPGNPMGKGKGASNGNTWTLANRNLNSSIPRPAYRGEQEGRVVVGITVDPNGNVIATRINKGTTITDESIQNDCQTSAKKIKFSKSPDLVKNNVIGEIVYNFKKN